MMPAIRPTFAQTGLAALFFTVILSALLTTGCDPYKQDSFTEQMVVEAFLTAGDPLPEIRLSRTLPFDEFYSFEAAALSGLDVRVLLTNDAGAVTETFRYLESDQRGVYLPEDAGATVQPGRVYRLEVRETPDQAPKLRARTFVPGGFELLSENGDTFIYQGPVQYEPTFTISFYPGRQNYYIASTLALQPDPALLTPFYAGFFDEDRPDQFLRVSSPIINEGNYEINEANNTITLTLPWISIAYFGPNEVAFYAIDTNLYDYVRTLSLQGGGPNQSPGQIDNVLWNIEGGIGIFGSRTGISSVINVVPFTP